MDFDCFNSCILLLVLYMYINFLHVAIQSNLRMCSWTCDISYHVRLHTQHGELYNPVSQDIFVDTERL